MYNNLNINIISDVIFTNIDLVNEYFIYLQNNKIQIIIDKLKKKILEINIKNDCINPLINILLNSDDKLCLFFLENMDILVLDKKDFYQKISFFLLKN